MAHHAATVLLLVLLMLCKPLFAQALPLGTVLRDCSGCPEMVLLPAGRFTMGAGASEHALFGVTPELAATELPAHEVHITRPFAMGRFAVTRDEWARYVASRAPAIPPGCAVLTPSTGVWAVDPARSWRDPGFAQNGREPVVCISWAEAKGYAAWLSQRTGHSYRLPTEAEWEYAARAGSSGINYWGDNPNLACAHANASDQARTVQHAYAHAAPEHSFRCNDGFVFTAPVDAFAPNAFGLYGMSGNVWQWVEDCFSASHAGAPPDGAARVDGDCSYRVNRGASWVNSPRYLRAAARHKDEAQARTSVLGLRVARDLAPPVVAASGELTKACGAMREHDFSAWPDAPSLAVSASLKPAGAELPPHCPLEGQIAPTIGWRMWLPIDNWNGKFIQAGCGVRCGWILDDGCQIVLMRGRSRRQRDEALVWIAVAVSSPQTLALKRN